MRGGHAQSYTVCHFAASFILPPLSLQVLRHVQGEGAEENGGEAELEAGAGVGGRDDLAAEEGAEGAGLDDGEQFEVRRWCSFELLIRIAHKSLTPVG